MVIWKEIIDLLKNFPIDGEGDLEETENLGERETKTKEFIERGFVSLVDASHVMMAVFKGERLIRFVLSTMSDSDFVNIESIKEPTMDDRYWPESRTHVSEYNSRYLEIIWKFAKKVGEDVKISMGTDTPMKAEIGKNIVFYLAPKIKSGE